MNTLYKKISTAALLLIMASPAIFYPHPTQANAIGDNPEATENPKVTLLSKASFTCHAKWNELCEDKKIVNVPEGYRLCRHELEPVQQIGDTEYLLDEQNDTSLTVYFRASGNGDRFKQQGASIELQAALYGLRTSESCTQDDESKNNIGSTQKARIQTGSETAKVTAQKNQQANNSSSQKYIPSTKAKPHACACSQWFVWMDVNNCLSSGENKDGSSCDTLKATIQCVEKLNDCRSIQNENCPYVAGLDQSKSLKRIFVEDSPYCEKQAAEKTAP